MNIPDEAVEAAAAVLLHGWLRYSDPQDFARTILETAAPNLMAEAWDEGYRGCYERYMYEPVPPNPYRSAGAGE